MRVLGLDLGERRVGVAISDTAGLLASPRATFVRGDDPEADRREIVELVRSCDARLVVVGLPLNMNGSRGRAARAALEEASLLADLLEPYGIEVETFDERLTTVSAERQLAQAGVAARARRQVVDQAAASVMLQAWLDSRSALGRGDA